jgi:hypothetical protein
MMSRKRFMILALVFGLAAIPAFSCLTPQQAFAMASDSCCLIMNQHCSERMPQAARSCCESGKQDSQPYLSTTAKWQGPEAQPGALPVSNSVVLLSPELATSLLNLNSPPQGSSVKNSVLRI